MNLLIGLVTSAFLSISIAWAQTKVETTGAQIRNCQSLLDRFSGGQDRTPEFWKKAYGFESSHSRHLMNEVLALRFQFFGETGTSLGAKPTEVDSESIKDTHRRTVGERLRGIEHHLDISSKQNQLKAMGFHLKGSEAKRYMAAIYTKSYELDRASSRMDTLAGSFMGLFFTSTYFGLVSFGGKPDVFLDPIAISVVFAFVLLTHPHKFVRYLIDRDWRFQKRLKKMDAFISQAKSNSYYIVSDNTVMPSDLIVNFLENFSEKKKMSAEQLLAAHYDSEYKTPIQNGADFIFSRILSASLNTRKTRRNIAQKVEEYMDKVLPADHPKEDFQKYVDQMMDKRKNQKREISYYEDNWVLTDHIFYFDEKGELNLIYLQRFSVDEPLPPKGKKRKSIYQRLIDSFDFVSEEDLAIGKNGSS